MLVTRLICNACGWHTICGEEQIAIRLRAIGLLRRAPHPPAELVAELLNSHLGKLPCDQCNSTGLLLGPVDDVSNSDDWQQAIICEVCRQPIPPERLEIYPTARRCVACQDIADRGAEPEEPDFCPKCGALVELRVSRGSGTTRYKLFCTGNPPCRI